jgi:hypothetical protein
VGDPKGVEEKDENGAGGFRSTLPTLVYYQDVGSRIVDDVAGRTHPREERSRVVARVATSKYKEPEQLPGRMKPGFCKEGTKKGV